MKKFILIFDTISPPITLYYQGRISHSSIPSSILSIIAYILILVSSFYYALLFIRRNSPKAYFFTRYVEDAGTFPVNSSQMFNFIQVSNPKINEKIPIDFSTFRIVGFDDAQVDDYMNDPSIVKTKDHWIYGYCNNDSDTEGISYLINQKYYEQSACIRKFYDKKEGKYFNTGEKGFRWPIIEKGCSNPERTYYGIIMQRCDMADQFLKDNGGPECKSSSDIDLVISDISLNFQLIDHYADILNYDEPFTKYFYEVTSAITANNFIIQHLNFNPVYMITYNGFFFENIEEENLYYFTQNEKQTFLESDLNQSGGTTNGCLIGIYFWMQNTLQYYERNYERVQDVLSDIGGISNTILIFARVLNFVINQFIILLDIRNLEKDSNFDFSLIKDKIMKTNSTLNKISEINNPPKNNANNKKFKNNDIRNKNQFYNNSSSMKDIVDLYKNTNLKMNKKTNFNNNNLNKRKALLNKYYFNYYNEKTNKKDDNDNMENIYIKNKSNERPTFFEINFNFNDQNKEKRKKKKREMTDKNTEYEENKNETKKFNFCKYFGYLICCKRNNKTISYYENFRKQIISEENIINNYFNIYNLLEASKIRKDKYDENVK